MIRLETWGEVQNDISAQRVAGIDGRFRRQSRVTGWIKIQFGNNPVIFAIPKKALHTLEVIEDYLHYWQTRPQIGDIVTIKVGRDVRQYRLVKRPLQCITGELINAESPA